MDNQAPKLTRAIAFKTLLLLTGILGAVSESKAAPLRCTSFGSVFEAELTAMKMEKKLSMKEFSGLPISPSGVPVIKAGSELNVLVDVGCMKDPSKGGRRLGWLKDLANSIHDKAHWRQHRSFQWRVEEDWDFFELQDVIEHEPCVDIVSPDGHFRAFSNFSDPFSKQQAHLNVLRYDEAMNSFLVPMLVRAKVVVAVIDTGVDFRHEDLFINRWRNPGEVYGNQRDDDRNGYVDDYDGYNFSSLSSQTGPEGDWPENRHGTHVAGLAAGRIDNGLGGVGISGLSKIMSLNVFGVNGITRSSILENAIRYAADHGADVINLSLGGREYSRTMRSALSYAIQKGSFIVAASGNEGIELCDNPLSDGFISPAVYSQGLDGMISVSSTDTLDLGFSLFSNFSPRLVEISAPGALTSRGRLVGILSSLPGDSYGYLAGTSMSAPVVSGAAALIVTWLKVYGYSVTPARVEFIIKAGSKSTTRLASAVQDGRTLDLRVLADYLKSKYPIR